LKHTSSARKVPNSEALIQACYSLDIIATLIRPFQANEFQPKTLNNYFSTLIWLLAFLKHHNHTTLSSTADTIRQQIRSAIYSKNVEVIIFDLSDLF
jgi:hypothetical protein